MLPIFELDSIAGIAQLAVMLLTSVTVIVQWLLFARS